VLIQRNIFAFLADVLINREKTLYTAAA